MGNLFQSVESFLSFFDQVESLVSAQNDDAKVSIVNGLLGFVNHYRIRIVFLGC